MKEQISNKENSGMKLHKRSMIGLVALAGIAFASGYKEKQPSEKLFQKLQTKISSFGETDESATENDQLIEDGTKPEHNSLSVSETEFEESIFDQNPDFFSEITTNGDFSPEERAKRTKEIAPGVTIFEDVGVTFYLVQNGDTLPAIREKLGALPQYSYVLDQRNKLQSFNIPNEELRPGMLIPIPMRNIDRHVTDEQFAVYAARGILEMKEHPRYGAFVNNLLNRMSEEDLVATCIAVAKQEAGGEPIGQFENHRWEPRQKVFSFSVYHILMRNAGLEARRNLNVSEGQMYHPKVATKVFLAYLYEKGGTVEKIFPINEHSEAFARYYNGQAWQEINPGYAENIRKYYDDAWGILDRIAEKQATMLAQRDQSPSIKLVSTEVLPGSADENIEVSHPIIHSPDITTEVPMPAPEVQTPVAEIAEVPPVSSPRENIKVEQGVQEEKPSVVADVKNTKEKISTVSIEHRGQVDWRALSSDDPLTVVHEVAENRSFVNSVSNESLDQAGKSLIDQMYKRYGKKLASESKIGVGEDGRGAYLIYEPDPNDHSSRITVRVI